MKKALLIICLALVVIAGTAIGVVFFLRSQDILHTPEPEISQDLAAKSPFKLVSIPAGSFMMGSNTGDENEKPVHKVTLTKPFYIGATEVTQAQWKAVMGGNPSIFKGDDLPVEWVSWNDCMKFCKKLTETEKAKGNLPAGYEYRLPTEAEWEYCCRAGATTEYCFGDAINMLKDYAWFDENSGRKTHPVGTKKPNAWGLYDMHGNVWEWCLDWYANKYASGDATDPRGPSSGSFRVRRGGSWRYCALNCRSALRNCLTPGSANYGLGFRLVLAQCSEKAVDQHTTPPVVGTTVPDLAAKSPLKLVSIPAGSFMMGSNNGDKNEKPVHKVTLTKPFYIGATEVTQSQWKAVMGNNPSYFKGDDLPVDYVSWNDCVEFCEKLTETEKAKGNLPADWEYRLPTEAEWEYCCRAGATSGYCFGNDISKLGEYAWFNDNSGKKTNPVGTKKPNAWGLYDMHGNVWEWCFDFLSDEYLSGDATDPRGPSNGGCRVLRGGSWGNGAPGCRAAYRCWNALAVRSPIYGFRVVATQCSEKAVDQLKLICIPVGSFLMGSNNGNNNEKPVHKVTISKPFFMSATQVTQAQWKAVMGGNPSIFKGDDLPVEWVSWNDCMKFCKKLTELERKKGNLPADWEYRLPTEAEWEYCCRAGSTTKYCFSDDTSKLGEYAWFYSNSSGKPHPVGTKKPNAWGLYDMHSNAWEWCFDWYGVYLSGDATNPVGPQSGSDRVFRGGSWGTDAMHCRCANRDFNSPDFTTIFLGFRLVLAQVLQ